MPCCLCIYKICKVLELHLQAHLSLYLQDLQGLGDALTGTPLQLEMSERNFEMISKRRKSILPPLAFHKDYHMTSALLARRTELKCGVCAGGCCGRVGGGHRCGWAGGQQPGGPVHPGECAGYGQPLLPSGLGPPQTLCSAPAHPSRAPQQVTLYSIVSNPGDAILRSHNAYC